MEFVTKREVFHGGKLRKAGDVIVSNDKLDAKYPHLFSRKGAKSQEVQAPKPVVTEPAKAETAKPEGAE
jgi:hypothetical protein